MGCFNGAVSARFPNPVRPEPQFEAPENPVAKRKVKKKEEGKRMPHKALPPHVFLHRRGFRQ